jgi:hypothetical protein
MWPYVCKCLLYMSLFPVCAWPFVWGLATRFPYRFPAMRDGKRWESSWEFPHRRNSASPPRCMYHDITVGYCLFCFFLPFPFPFPSLLAPAVTRGCMGAWGEGFLCICTRNKTKKRSAFFSQSPAAPRRAASPAGVLFVLY